MMTDLTAFNTKVTDAYERASNWLYEANIAAEKGNERREAECERKAQYWFDRYNKLTGETSEFGLTPEQQQSIAAHEYAMETTFGVDPDWNAPASEATPRDISDSEAEWLNERALQRDEARADVERLKDYIALCCEKFGKEMPYDPTDTALIALLSDEGKDEER